MKNCRYSPFDQSECYIIIGGMVFQKIPGWIPLGGGDLQTLIVAGLVCFLLASEVPSCRAHDGNPAKVPYELEVMRKEDPDKYKDFRYALRHIRSVNKKQARTTSVFVAKAIADHVHEKRFRYASDEHRLNFLSLIMGIIRVESCFDPNAVSSKNARGLMQVHWPTWRQYFSSREEVHDPHKNLSVGTSILRLYLNASNNDLRAALYRYLGARDDGYADRVIASAISFKKGVLSERMKDISGTE